MASLKDLRNRIACVKATQKITKAMQMVAAAKLRRAQEAAEAARPYAERMDAVLANLAAASQARPARRGCWPAPARTSVHLLVVGTADRGLCGGFNSSIVRARPRPRQPADRRGQGRSRSSPSAARAATSCAAQFAEPDRRRRSTCATSSSSASPTPTTIAAAGAGAVRGRRVRRRHAVLLAFKSVITQIPTAQQLIPAEVDGGGRPIDLQRRGLRIRAGRGGRSSPTCCRATSRSRSSARCSRTGRLLSRRADDRDGQRHPQRRRHDQQADAAATTAPARRRSPRN